MVDVANENINDHLNGMNSGGGKTKETKAEAWDDADQVDGTRLPVKKVKQN